MFFSVQPYPLLSVPKTLASAVPGQSTVQSMVQSTVQSPGFALTHCELSNQGVVTRT